MAEHENFRDRAVLITGGLGFIGSTLARALVELGARVTLVDSLFPDYGGNLFNVDGIADRVRVNVSDVRDAHGFGELVRGQDYLFNLAGQTSHLDSMEDPRTDLEINCLAQLSILEACRRINPGVRVVFASTRQLYGRPHALPVSEEHPVRPVDVNGINKWAGESYHLLYSEVYGIRSTVLRLTNTYGPRMRVRDARQTFLGTWIRQVLQGEEFLVYGDGSQLRDFNYVDDVVEALLLAASRDAAIGEILNLGAEPVSLLAVARLLVTLNGGGKFRAVPFPEQRRKIDIGDYYASYERAVRLLGWRPRVPLETGLRRALSFYQNHGPHYWSPAPGAVPRPQAALARPAPVAESAA